MDLGGGLNGTLYAVFPDTTDQVGSQFNVDVYFTKSFDQGDSWLAPVILNGEGPFVGDQFFPWIETDSSGRLHVVYLDSRNTSQPDSASLLISYTGPRIDRAGLLRYIVSYRQHQDFHDTCVERMFLDIIERCKAEKLTVYARYQRRGGSRPRSE